MKYCAELVYFHTVYIVLQYRVDLTHDSIPNSSSISRYEVKICILDPWYSLFRNLRTFSGRYCGLGKGRNWAGKSPIPRETRNLGCTAEICRMVLYFTTFEVIWRLRFANYVLHKYRQYLVAFQVFGQPCKHWRDDFRDPKKGHEPHFEYLQGFKSIFRIGLSLVYWLTHLVCKSQKCMASSINIGLKSNDLVN